MTTELVYQLENETYLPKNRIRYWKNENYVVLLKYTLQTLYQNVRK